MKRLNTLLALIAVSLSAISVDARAEVEAWRLVATAGPAGSDTSIPSFLAQGQTFTVDMLVDNSLSAPSGGGLLSVTVDGVTSPLNTQFSDLSGMAAFAHIPSSITMNLIVADARTDGLTNVFVWDQNASLKSETSNVDTLLSTLSSDIQGLSGTDAPMMTVELGQGHTVFATPLSLTLSPVPEPGTAGLFMLGMCGIGLLRNKRS
jgi:hypothetical protein